MLGYGNPESVNRRVGIVNVDMAGVAMKKQIERNTCSACIRLQIMSACNAILLHHLRNEWSKWRLSAGVPQGAIQSV